MKRVIIFIDHANIYHTIKKNYDNVNYEKLRDLLKGNTHLVDTKIYLGKPNKISEELKRFYAYLNKAGFTLHFRRLRKQSDGTFIQKGVDILMSSHISSLAKDDYFDKAVIVSGDADFIEAIKTLKEHKKEIEVWSFRHSLAKELRRETGKENIKYIDDIIEEIELAKGNG